MMVVRKSVMSVMALSVLGVVLFGFWYIHMRRYQGSLHGGRYLVRQKLPTEMCMRMLSIHRQEAVLCWDLERILIKQIRDSILSPNGINTNKILKILSYHEHCINASEQSFRKKNEDIQSRIRRGDTIYYFEYVKRKGDFSDDQYEYSDWGILIERDSEVVYRSTFGSSTVHPSMSPPVDSKDVVREEDANFDHL